MAKSRLGLLGPILAFVALAAAGTAIWYMVHARPEPGAVIDTVQIGPDAKLVVRGEQGGHRSFLELHENGALKWQALIPHYAGTPGRPALAWNEKAITVRVDRDNGRAEVFAFTREHAKKLGLLRLAPDKEPIHIHREGPITLTDEVRGYELVGGPTWHELIAVELGTGNGAWRVELGPSPITAGGVEGGTVWLEQAGKRRTFDGATGREQTVTQTSK